jgi:hypothetical protein
MAITESHVPSDVWDFPPLLNSKNTISSLACRDRLSGLLIMHLARIDFQARLAPSAAFLLLFHLAEKEIAILTTILMPALVQAQL